MRRFMVFVCVAVLGVTLALAAGAKAQPPGQPSLWVELDTNGLWAQNWPAEAELTVTADHPTTGEDPDITLVVTCDEDGSFGDSDLFPGLEPGWFITVSDGVTTKTHTVRDISIDRCESGDRDHARNSRPVHRSVCGGLA